MAEHATTASADFCSPAMCCHVEVRASSKLCWRIRLQISPNKNVNFRCTSSPSTSDSVGNGFAHHGLADLRASEASIAFLFVALQFWREMCPAAINQVGSYASHFAGFLPTVDHSSATNLPVGARPRLVLHSTENIWHTIASLSPVFVQGTG